MARAHDKNAFAVFFGTTALHCAGKEFPALLMGQQKFTLSTSGVFYAKKRNLEVICIRLGGVNKRNEIHFEEDPLYDKVLLYEEDFIELIRHCIKIDMVLGNFAIFYAVSNALRKVHSLNNFLN